MTSDHFIAILQPNDVERDVRALRMSDVPTSEVINLTDIRLRWKEERNEKLVSPASSLA